MTMGSAGLHPRRETPGPWRAPAPARVASLLPFLVAIAIPVLNGQRLSSPMFTEPPVFAGLPPGIVVGALVIAWAAFGALVIWTTHSRLATTLALAFLTLPSMFAMILGPAIVLILENLGDLG